MALKKNLTKAEWEALPESTRSSYETEKIYVPDGENWKLDAEGEDISGLKSALDKERKAREQFEKDLRAVNDKYKDVDLDKYNEVMTKAEEAETNDLKSKNKIDELLDKQRSTLEQKHATEKKKLEDQITALNTELDRVTIDGSLRMAFEKAGVIADRIDDAVDLTKPRAKREDGKLVLYDPDGTKLDISLDTYAKEVLKESKPWLYAASGVGGSGAQNGTKSADGKKIIKRSELDKMHPSVASALMADVRSGKAELVDQ